MGTPQHRHNQSRHGHMAANIVHSAGDVASTIGNGIEHGASAVGSGVKNVLSGAEGAIEGVGHFFEDALFWVVVVGGVLIYYNRDSLKAATRDVYQSVKSGADSVYSDAKEVAPYAAGAALLL